MGRPAENLVTELPKEELMRRNRKALALIESWAKEDPEYDRATRKLLEEAIRESRGRGGLRLPDER